MLASPVVRDFTSLHMVNYTSANAIAEFVRKVGPERATVDVVASQLRILGIIGDGELRPVSRLALTVMIQTLVAIDAYEAAEDALAEAAARQRPEPVPVALEDTTLEPVDGPLDAW